MTKKEIKEIKNIVCEYADIDNKMRKNEDTLKKISAEQTELMQRLEKNEEKEKELMQVLSAKYPGLTLIDLIKTIQ